MHFTKLSSLFFVLSSIFIISYADENTEEDIETADNNSSKNETENLTEDFEIQQVAIGDLLLPKGVTLDDFVSGQARTMMKPNLWPNAHVYYDMDESVEDELRDTVLEAFDIWKKDSCLKFTEGCQGDVCIHVTTTNPDGVHSSCYTYAGASPGGQNLNLGPGCESLKTALHEIGHALGFLHEMARFDRDNVIIVNEKYILPDYIYTFEKMMDGDDDTEYDLSSIMHYGANEASIDKMFYTMVSLNPHYQDLMGKSDLPSFRDLSKLNHLYSCSSGCPNDDLHCENGGYLSPYGGDGEKCSCVCPPRIEGSACEDKPEAYDYYDIPSCSKNVTEETVIETPNYPHLSSPPERCSWWIQAPEGQQVQVEFEDFSFTEDPDCFADRVEIRYKELYDGDIICGERAKGETYTSTTGSVVIFIGGDNEEYRPQDLRGFTAKVTFV